MPLVDRLASAVITGAPPVLVLLGMWLGWNNGLLIWQDLVVLAVFYTVIGSGVTVGFHRLLTHRSFKSTGSCGSAFAVLGSAAAEGPVIDWVATHRKHHQFSDEEGDPHSPHLDHRHGWRGELWGFVHAHIGWVFSDMEVADEQRYAKDLSPIRGSSSWTGRSCSGWCSVWPPRSASGWPHRHRVRRPDRPALGRRGPDLLRPPRDVQHQLGVPLLRPP